MSPTTALFLSGFIASVAVGCSSSQVEGDGTPGSDLGDELSIPPSEAREVTFEEHQGLRMARIPAGTFIQGSPETEAGRVAELEVLHRVTLSRDFVLGVTEVTQDQFARFVGYQPSRFRDCGGDCPVESISWNEAAAFANAVSAVAGLPACYDCSGEGPSVECELDRGNETPYHCEGYRLPTESEWEYAARAGSRAAFSNGGDLQAADIRECGQPVVLDDGTTLSSLDWYCGSTGNTRSRPVAQLEPNAWGLYDVHGNVWEWCHDGMPTDSLTRAVTDPWGAEGEPHRVFRGGGWTDHPRATRAGNRRADLAPTRYDFLGVRIARTAPRPDAISP